MTGKQYSKIRSIVLVTFVYLFPILALSGCTNIRLIGDYDEQIDKSITAFQRNTETFLTSLERNADMPEGGYDANAKFYDEAKVDLSALRVRAAAIPKNEITVKQIDLLIDSLAKLEELHKQGISRQQIPPLRSAFNSSCTAVLKLELAKKRGD